jgi:uncharacterized protein DUF2817
VSADGQRFFSPDYFTARDRFRDAARGAGATLDALTLQARGPLQEELTIDIARLGSSGTRRVLLHTCGLHGVEAFAGSAVQLAVLATPPIVPADCELVMVHVLNPYGMAWLRRVNENNVDLNRNFVGTNERREGTPTLYQLLDPLLNPRSPPRADGFLLRLGAFALRHGPTATRQAIAEGQFEFPRGLFFGGTSLEPGPGAFLEWLGRHLARAERVFALDLHTGLGHRGESTLILEAGVGTASAPELGRALGSPVVDPAAGQAVFRIRGGMGNALPQALPRARVDFLLQEIGTYPTLAVLRALREENRCHHHLAQVGVRHPAKLELLEALRPDSASWRKRAVVHGMSLVHAVARWTFHEAGGIA